MFKKNISLNSNKSDNKRLTISLNDIRIEKNKLWNKLDGKSLIYYPDKGLKEKFELIKKGKILKHRRVFQIFEDKIIFFKVC